MRKTFLFVAFLLMSALVSTTMILSVEASVQSWSWRRSIFFGYDNFYGYNVVAYEESSTAILDVNVWNNYAPGAPINVSAVKVGFDWNTNYTSAQASLTSPIVMQPNEVRLFTISFILPNTTVASNLYLHGYTIYVEHVNSTTGAQKIVGTWIGHSYNMNYYFVVYSSEQAAAQKASQRLSAMPVVSFPTARARLLMSRAANATNTAVSMYSQGDFAGARTQYETALSLINQAFLYEETREASLDASQVALLDAQVKNLEAWANYAIGLSNLWTLLGLAAVLFAIGYIIKGLAALRKAGATQ